MDLKALILSLVCVFRSLESQSSTTLIRFARLIILVRPSYNMADDLFDVFEIENDTSEAPAIYSLETNK